jgi:hypothetical protein
MPTRAHHRSRSSIDRVFDLLADLQDNQIALLLEDLNHTTPSNVPVSEAIAFFSPDSSCRPKRLIPRPSSPTLRQPPDWAPQGKRISSVPEPFTRPKTAIQPSQTPSSALFPTMPTPEPLRRPSTATPSSIQQSRTLSYKRISRPSGMLLSTTAIPDPHNLLVAYLSDAPISSVTSLPTTPQLASPFSPMATGAVAAELDLLEPSPMRTPLGYGRAGQDLAENMCNIFEILASN